MQTDVKMPTIIDQINHLKPIVEALKRAGTDAEKLNILNCDKTALAFLKKHPFLQKFLTDQNEPSEIAIKSLLVIGQGPLVLQQIENTPQIFEKLKNMIDQLMSVQIFYNHLGGIVGYHHTVLSLIAQKSGLVETKNLKECYSKPEGIDQFNLTPSVLFAIRHGIESMPLMSEFYPVGGAGDRLQLCDEETKERLPVAKLVLLGKNLLEHLICDLQAREYLYYKLTSKQCITPVTMMTSQENNNHQNLLSLCKEAKWFDRPQDSFRFFKQPLVPVISEDGAWCLSEPLKLILKPGGHGVIWKLAQLEGIFDWLKKLNRKKALIRQINNPLAGMDFGLIAFTGEGCRQNKAFGFASCPRVLNAAEGMNVLAERQTENGFSCTITCIEYTDFSEKGISDTPLEEGSPYSVFPANTNILFADLKEVESAIESCPIPGMIINMKNTIDSLNNEGQTHKVRAGRLESTMQNIADQMTDVFKEPLKAPQQADLKTFLTYNHRHKTISTTKKTHVPGESTLETPEGCFFDLQKNMHDLLSNYCGVGMPNLKSPGTSPNLLPSFFVYLHPAIGPLFNITAKKIRGGTLFQGAELSIEAAEIDISNIIIDGSLRIKAEALLGHKNPSGHVEYSEKSGKCTLKNVKIHNRGIDWSTPHKWWKGDFSRTESVEIQIEGSGEFYAENIVFEGAIEIKVPDGWKVEAIWQDDELKFKKTKISEPTWCWDYFFSPSNHIDISKRTVTS